MISYFIDIPYFSSNLTILPDLRSKTIVDLIPILSISL